MWVTSTMAPSNCATTSIASEPSISIASIHESTPSARRSSGNLRSRSDALAHHLELLRRSVFALDRQGDNAPLGAADHLDGVVEADDVDGRTIDGEDDVAADEPGLGRAAARHRLLDREMGRALVGADDGADADELDLRLFAGLHLGEIDDERTERAVAHLQAGDDASVVRDGVGQERDA